MKNSIAIPILMICLVVLGCSRLKEMANTATGPSSNSEAPASNTAVPTGPASTAGADPKADIVSASRKFIALPSFSAKMDGTGTNEIHSKVEYAAPDRFHVTYLGGTAGGMELIMIGKQMYMKAAGKWSRSPIKMGDTMPNLRDAFSEEGLKSLNDVKFIGEDSVDGKPAYLYSYRNVTVKGDYPFTSKIWVGRSSGLPMKVEVEYENGTLKQMTIIYDTDTPVTIEAPAN